MVNGNVAERFFEHYNPYWKQQDARKWKVKMHKFVQLFEYLDKAYDSSDPDYQTIRNKYYYYNMNVGHMLYYSGIKRKNGKPQQFIEYSY